MDIELQLGKWKAVQWKNYDSWDIVDSSGKRVVADLLEEEAFAIVDAHNNSVERIRQLAY